VTREMWWWHPDDGNDVEATTHTAWQAVSVWWAAVWCAGAHPEIAPERSMDDMVDGIDRSAVLGSKWYRDMMKS